jgi:hypothetical protein
MEAKTALDDGVFSNLSNLFCMKRSRKARFLKKKPYQNTSFKGYTSLPVM